MKRLLIAAVALLLTFAPPAGASWYNESPQELVEWAGCTADVVVSENRSVLDSFYRPSTHTVYIGTRPGEPEFVIWTVVFHETGHCLQAQNGELDTYQGDPVPLELGADRWAAELACRRGMDGSKMVHDTFVWAYYEFNYEGDENHGTLAERIAAGYSAPSCQVNAPQAQ